MISDSVIYSAVVLMGSGLISYGMDKRDKKWNEKENARIRSLIGKLFEYKDIHTKESADVRLEFSKQLAALSATLQVTQEQYAQILRRLDELKSEVTEVRNHQRND